MQQRSSEWYAARLGKVTASRISDVMAKGRSGEPSRTRATYMAELVCERLTGQPHESYQSPDMLRGSDVEAQAKASYSLMHGVDLVDGEFDPHPTIDNSGASPDTLIGNDGLAEFKCPKSGTHIDTLLDEKIDRSYILQMQWQMACTGRKYCDFVSFDPNFPVDMQLFVQRIKRDDVVISEIEAEVRKFLAELAGKIGVLNAKYAVAA